MTPWLAQTARLHPERPACYWQQRPHTYRELSDEASRRANVLKDHGVTPGDRVVLIGPTSLEYVRILHAILWRGATLVPMAPDLAVAQRAERLADLAPALVLGNSTITGDVTGAPSMSFRTLADRSDRRDDACPPAEIEPQSVATLFYTSGTTGRPKPVPLTYAHHRSSAMASALRSGVAPDDRWLACLPCHHVGGMAIVLRSLLHGTAFDLVETFEATHVRDYLESLPVTRASFVPTMMHRLLEAGLEAPDHLRTVLVGGGPIDPPLVERARTRSMPMSPTWGMTETTSQFATMPLDRAERSPGAVGPPLKGGSYRIVDDDDTTLPAGEYGRLQVRGPMVFDGYWNRPELNRRSFVDGWFDTGDVGYQSEHGELVIASRASDRIVSGGENVDPQTVEASLRRHPDVREACVIGLDNPEWGEVVAAAVETSEPSLDAECLERHCREHLSPHERPKRWHIVETLPRTSTHKLDRHRIQTDFDTLEG